MKTLIKTLQHESRSDRFWLYPLFDIHLGSAACDEKLLRRDVAEIASKKNALVILGGDMIDAINHQDQKRYNGSQLAPWCRTEDDIDDIEAAQIDMLAGILHPIQDKIIAIVEGNHEYASGHHNGRSIYKDICARLAGSQRMSELALGVEGFLVLTFSRKSAGQKSPKAHTWPMTIYTRHGFGGGRKKGGKINNLSDVMYAYDCDLALSGHVHDKLYTSVVRTGPGNGRKPYIQKEIHGVTCGTYLAPYLTPTAKNMPRNTYGQRSGYMPNAMGIPRIEIHPDKRRLSVIWSSAAHDAGVEIDFDEEAA